MARSQLARIAEIIQIGTKWKGHRVIVNVLWQTKPGAP
jgi:hypothetical protein